MCEIEDPRKAQVRDVRYTIGGVGSKGRPTLVGIWPGEDAR